MDFKSFGNPLMEGGGRRPPGNLARQGSIYSLTFDELQTTMGGSVGKDFGSMNMDELLKNIWSAEEAPLAGYHHRGDGHDGGGFGGTGLQRQGSLTLPRTISQKTVDEVWKGLSKENDDSGFGPPRLPPRQPTLGEMTLEEFLAKAGVVREETQFENGLFSNLPNPQNDPGFGALGFQPGSVNPNDVTNQITFQSGDLPLSANGFRSAQKQQPVFPKQTNFGGYVGPVGGPVIRNGIVGLSDAVMNGKLVTTGGLQGGMVGLGGGGAVTVAAAAAGSPAVSSDGIGKSNGDTSSVSPTPYVFSGLLRGRKSGGVEKVVERRQRRMIKNRESAARSRARKQAYTMELEAEVSKLKEKNQELKRKQFMETMSVDPGGKRRRLERTKSGPW